MTATFTLLVTTENAEVIERLVAALERERYHAHVAGKAAVSFSTKALTVVDIVEPSKTLFNVWVEGYETTGEQGRAYLAGAVVAHDFREACNHVARIKNWGNNYDKDKGTFWGCGLFDNEVAARKAFG